MVEVQQAVGSPVVAIMVRSTAWCKILTVMASIHGQEQAKRQSTITVLQLTVIAVMTLADLALM